MRSLVIGAAIIGAIAPAHCRPLRPWRVCAPAASAQKAVFVQHAARLDEEMAQLRIRQRYIAGKVQLWAAQEREDLEEEQRVAERLQRIAQELRK